MIFLSKIFVGIDPSFTATGIAISDAEQSFVHTACIKTSKDDVLQKRIQDIIKGIFDNIREKEPDFSNIVLGIEDYSYGSMRSVSATMLHELSGNIKFQLWLKDIKYYVISSNSWKKMLFGSKFRNGMTKDSSIMFTFKKYDVELLDNNICDAFNIMKFTQKAYEFENLHTPEQWNHGSMEYDIFNKFFNPKTRKKRK